MPSYLYACINEAPVYEAVVLNKGKKIINRIQSGTYVAVEEEQGDFYKIVTAGPDGWMHKTSLSANMGIKIFYLDVGQGDGMLIEVGKYKILIDAGPKNNMHSYLSKWQYTYLLAAQQKVHIDCVFISHFDADHYKGITPILNDERFTFGTIYHAGILKFADKTNPYASGLGNIVAQDDQSYLTHVFDNLLELKEPAAFNRDVTAFLKALTDAHQTGRVKKVKRISAGDVLLKKSIEANAFKIEVLAPFTEKINNRHCFLYWGDEGKTVNGHSLVLKFHFGQRSFLFGGDLNSRAETYLLNKYGTDHPFKTDVAKSCHHGSSDFTEAFMQCVNPFATVISSGDNEMYSHPRADAIGCAGKYSRGARPLVYSTELARSATKNKLLFGMINLRCNGTDIYMNQMKEAGAQADLWDSYLLPAKDDL